MATLLGGSNERAARCIRGVDVLCASYADNPSSMFWTADAWSRTRLAANLDVLALPLGGFIARVCRARDPGRPARRSRSRADWAAAQRSDPCGAARSPPESPAANEIT